MKPFVALAVAALFVSSTAEARGLRIRVPVPRLSVAPTISPAKTVVPDPARLQRSGGLIILPGVGAARASANSSQPLLDTKSGSRQDWSPTPFAARQQGAAALPAYQPPQPQAPKIEKAVFVCPPSQNVGGFCVLN
ncbi:hypothetical protein PY365_14650 [Roseiarcaceae bacterium H3SJ34-1]|uniref:hypothetical protein n=1 Tax=Terripilifer ovatus TaxID=3032367 RepID=UPI003AB9AB19|nr:hypothetical protein [Roseiarcaceae bacterium H3SJ34-1]